MVPRSGAYEVRAKLGEGGGGAAASGRAVTERYGAEGRLPRSLSKSQNVCTETSLTAGGAD